MEFLKNPLAVAPHHEQDAFGGDQETSTFHER